MAEAYFTAINARHNSLDPLFRKYQRSKMRAINTGGNDIFVYTSDEAHNCCGRRVATRPPHIYAAVHGASKKRHPGLNFSDYVETSHRNNYPHRCYGKHGSVFRGMKEGINSRMPDSGSALAVLEGDDDHWTNEYDCTAEDWADTRGAERWEEPAGTDEDYEWDLVDGESIPTLDDSDSGSDSDCMSDFDLLSDAEHEFEFVSADPSKMTFKEALAMPPAAASPPSLPRAAVTSSTVPAEAVAGHDEYFEYEYEGTYDEHEGTYNVHCAAKSLKGGKKKYVAEGKTINGAGRGRRCVTVVW